MRKRQGAVMDRGQWSPEAKVPLAPRGEAGLSGSPRERRHTQMQKAGDNSD